MALFGGAKKSFFDMPIPYSTPGIGDDLERRRRGLLNYGENEAPGINPSLLGSEEQSSFRPALPDFSQGNMRPQLPDSNNQPRLPAPSGQAGQIDPRLLSMIGPAPVKRKPNWLRDVAAGGLAVMGDAFSDAGNTAAGQHRGGGGGSAVDMLAKQWLERGTTYKQQQQEYDNRRRIAALPGMSEREMAAYMADPKAWGSSMASNATSQYGAATLNPGDQRYLGDGNGVYQAPTRGELYAKSIGKNPGTDDWNTAISDQEMGGNGPTAFGNQQTLQGARDAQQARMEQLRQQGRMGMEGVRQGNRMQVRGSPTYRDSNPPPPRGGGTRAAPRLDSLPMVSSPADARKLPSGTKFRTPDGRVKMVP